MIERERIVACARQFLGVRFAHQGRSTAGLDCLGLLLVTARAADISLREADPATIEVPNYGTRPDTELLQQKLQHYLIQIALADVMPADVILLNIQGFPQHLAILSDYPSDTVRGMIHAYAVARKVVEH